MTLKKPSGKRYKKSKYEIFFSDIIPTDKLLSSDFFRANLQISDFYRFIEHKAKILEEKEFQIKNNFELDMITRVDHITLILEDFLNTNKEILKRLEYFDEKNFNQHDEPEEKMIEIQDLSEEVIEKIIFDHIDRNKEKEIYPSDIAFAFNIDAEKVFNICQRLKKEGKLIERTY